MLNYIYNHLDLTHFAFNNDAIYLAVVSSSFIDDIGERVPTLIKRCSKKNVSPLLYYSFHQYRFVTMKKLIYYSCQYIKLRNVRKKLPYIDFKSFRKGKSYTHITRTPSANAKEDFSYYLK
jgi:hypothetical protein